MKNDKRRFAAELLERRTHLAAVAGDRDPSFVTSGFDRFDLLRGTVAQSDGKLLFAGTRRLISSEPNPPVDAPEGDFLFRVNANGSPDTTFGAGGRRYFSGSEDRFFLRSTGEQVNSLIPLAGGRHLVLGRDLARLAADGSIDASYGNLGFASFAESGWEVYGFIVEADESAKILVMTEGIVFAFAFTPDGNRDNSFFEDGRATELELRAAMNLPDADISRLSDGPDGKFYISGRTSDAPVSQAFVARFNANGSVDRTFSGDGVLPVAPAYQFATPFLITLGDGSLLLSTQNPQLDYELFRIRPSAQITQLGDARSEDFATPAFATLQPDGKILTFGGSFQDFYVARFLTNGKMDPTFGDAGFSEIFRRYDEDYNPFIGSALFGFARTPDGGVVALGEYEDDGLNETGDGTIPVLTKFVTGPASKPFARVTSSGTLLATGYAFGDVMEVRRAGNQIIVSDFAAELSFNAASVRRVQLDGNGGFDRLTSLGTQGAMLNGGDGEDTITGGNGNDIITGSGRADLIRPGLGKDDVFGGGGEDKLDFSTSPAGMSFDLDNVADDGMFGGSGGSNFHSDFEMIVGSPFRDRIDGRLLTREIRGGNGNDQLSGATRLFGDGGNDLIFGTMFADEIRGGGGNDTIDGNAGDDQLFGDADNDFLNGLAGDDRMFGNAGNDTLRGGAGMDLHAGGTGDDLLEAAGDNEMDVIDGNAGFDRGEVDAIDLILNLEQVL